MKIKEKVLITTSGLGSRLAEYTEFTNKSLVPVGDKPTIARIIESYPVGTEFVVTLGYKGDLVKDFLELAYPEKDFTFVWVENYSGAGSSLGYSMLQAAKYLQTPFVYHAGDTILPGTDNFIGIGGNWLTGVKGERSDLYVSFDVSGENVRQIYEKGQDSFDFIYPGVMGVEDYSEYWNALESAVVQAKESDSVIDLDGAKSMISSGVGFSVVPIHGWFDTGTISNLQTAQQALGTKLPTLTKRDESIFLVNGKVIKFFSSSEINLRRVRRSQILAPGVPPVIETKDNWYTYKYREGKTLGESRLKGDILRVLEWADRVWWSRELPKTFDQKRYEDSVRRFYIEKTMARIHEFEQRFGEKDVPRTINGLHCDSIKNLVEFIDQDCLLVGIPGLIHGDFVLDNIVMTSDGPLGIDWRHDFAGDLEIGDIQYDLAKLIHSCHVSHRVLLSDQYKFHQEENQWTIDLLKESSLLEIAEEIKIFAMSKGYDFDQIQLIAPLIWINMAPMMTAKIGKFLFGLGQYHLAKMLK